MTPPYLEKIKSEEHELTAVVHSRKGRLFGGEALAITSYNDSGEFDVLPLHENFISLIKKYLKIFPKEGAEINIPLEVGVLKVKAGKVDIYIGLGGK